MSSVIASIDTLIRQLERAQNTTNLAMQKAEEIVTPDWAKEDEDSTQTEDCNSCSCNNATTTKKKKKAEDEEFPFAAALSIDNFNQFLQQNADKQHTSDFVQNLRDKRGMNLLHCACINDCAELIEPLIRDHHIDINQVDNDGYSPLFYCVNQWSEECVAELLPFQPRLDLVSKDCVIHATGFPIYICGGKTVFHQAAEINSVECCRLILDYLQQFKPQSIIPMLFQTDFNGATAMDIARMHNRAEMLDLFHSFLSENCGQDTDTLKLVQKEQNEKWSEQQIKQYKREYHLKLRQRIKETQEQKQKEEETNISKYYKPKYSDLFFQTEQEYFPLHLLDDTLLKLLDELKTANHDQVKIDAVITKYRQSPIHFLQEPLRGVFVFRVFSQDLCDKLLSESENYMQQSAQLEHGGLLPITRPNSMNSYGLVLNQIGMSKAWNCFIREIVKPLSDALIPRKVFKMNRFVHTGDESKSNENKEEERKKEWHFRSHHTFLIRYKQGEDVNLDTHVDASAVTLNVCIGNQPGFEGGKVYFHAIANSEEDLEKDDAKYASPHPEDGSCPYCKYELFHRIGFAVLHVGNYIHGTNTLTKGTRSNVVIWCKEYEK